MFTKNSFMSFYQGTPSEKGAFRCYDAIYKALGDLGILTDLTLIGALATTRVEVGRAFLPVVESILAGLQYELRRDLGNVIIGDGVKYRGRGYLQLTGKNNYIEYGLKTGLDLVNNPDLALIPENSAKLLAQYFKNNGVNSACNAKNWFEARLLVNGGINGLTTFLSVIDQYISKITNMNIKKLEIVKVLVVAGKTVVVGHRFDTEDENSNDVFSWVNPNELTNEQALEFVITIVDTDIEVSLNLTV